MARFLWLPCQTESTGRGRARRRAAASQSDCDSPRSPGAYLTSDDDAVKRDKLAVLLSTTAGTGRMHESFDVDDDREFTREWFSWADAMFCELALDIVGIGFGLPRTR